MTEVTGKLFSHQSYRPFFIVSCVVSPPFRVGFQLSPFYEQAHILLLLPISFMLRKIITLHHVEYCQDEGIQSSFMEYVTISKSV